MQLNDIIEYAPETGLFRWKVRPKRSVPGWFAGCPHVTGYLRVRVNGKLWKAHRLAYLLMTGAEPQGDMDHVNGVRDDNRWINLRLATRTENLRNRKSVSPSGLKGVMRTDNAAKPFRARIKVDGRNVHLGTFATAEEAHAAYCAAAEKHYGAFARFS